MSFRRDKGKELRWQTWLQTHRDRLVHWGIPLSLLVQESHWTYFLEHCYFTPQGSAEPVIIVDKLTPDQAKQLCEFLETDSYYPNSDALNRLQFLLKRGRHAQTK